MRPGAWSHEGFLGPSERLEDVLRVDRQTLEELELEPGQLADTLDCLLGARDATWPGALVDGRFEVLMIATAGCRRSCSGVGSRARPDLVIGVSAIGSVDSR
jgi:hypothetical protein